MARFLNLILLVLEVRGLMLSRITERRWKTLAYYTQLSNIVTAASALLLVVFGQLEAVTQLRYLSTCMLVMTAAVTVCVLVPLGGDPHMLLYSGHGLYHHVLCPIVCTLSYVFVEHHAGPSQIFLPIVVTLTYGITLFALNARGVVDGPYPFFRIREQSRLATVMWFVVLLLVIAMVSAGILAVAF